jgi:HlyD family secretion protein
LRFTPATSKASSSGGFVASLMPRRPQQPKQVKENSLNGSTTRTIWVLQDKKTTPIEVTVGLTDGRRTQIVSGGLQAGARVIIGMQKTAK